MTEKLYGGSANYGTIKVSKDRKDKLKVNESKDRSIIDKSHDAPTKEDTKNNKPDIEGYSDYLKAGKIASETVAYAKSFIKPGMKLLEIAEKIESKILELGGKPAFPCNLSINEIAAHYTPSFNDETLASGLLKVDLGVHVNGFVADTAFSLDLENTEENKKLIKAAELALDNALNLIKSNNNPSLSDIGRAIENSIKSLGLQPIQNLSGHSIEKYNLHAGITIPNFDNSSDKIVEQCVIAIEPFSTSGLGSVRDGRPSGIYHLEKPGAVRDSFARSVLDFIAEEYQTLPFCSRWIHKKFGTRGLLALRQIEQSKALHHYPQLVEKGSGKVAQAEHTVMITEKEKIVTTL